MIARRDFLRRAVAATLGWPLASRAQWATVFVVPLAVEENEQQTHGR